MIWFRFPLRTDEHINRIVARQVKGVSAMVSKMAPIVRNAAKSYFLRYADW